MGWAMSACTRGRDSGVSTVRTATRSIRCTTPSPGCRDSGAGRSPVSPPATARSGAEAAVVAALAHFVERAVSTYQPTYLLLARSVEQPRITTLLTGILESLALEDANSAAFSLDALLPELRPLLSIDPEVFSYCRDGELDALAPEIAPYAV